MTKAKKLDAVESIKDLQIKISALEKEVVQKKIELRFGKLKDVRSISKLKDEIARAKTALKIKELSV